MLLLWPYIVNLPDGANPSEHPEYFAVAFRFSVCAGPVPDRRTWRRRSYIYIGYHTHHRWDVRCEILGSELLTRQHSARPSDPVRCADNDRTHQRVQTGELR